MQLSMDFLYRLIKTGPFFHIAGLLVLFQLMLVLPVQAESVSLNMDLFEPCVLETEDKYVYVTSVGNYSFSKEDGSYKYHWVNGSLLCPSVKFDVQYLAGDSWEDFDQEYFSLRGLSNEHFAFSVNVLNSSRLMGVLDVDCLFYRDKAPKLTARFREIEPCKPYRLVFKVTVPQAWRYFIDAGNLRQITSTAYLMRAKRVRVLNIEDVDSSFKLLIDWRDFGDADCVLRGSTVRVLFPVNVEAVDPTTVAETSHGLATAWSCQRNLFWAQDRWFASWQNSTGTQEHVVYSSSTDGASWASPAEVSAKTKREHSVFYNGTYASFAFVKHPLRDFYFRAGEPQADGSFIWLDTEQTVLTDVAGTENKYVGIATDSSGYPFIVYTHTNLSASPDTYELRVIKSAWNNGSWSTEFNTKLSDLDGKAEGQIVPLTTGKMYALYQSGGVLKGQLWNGTAWETEETCTTANYLGTGISSVAINDNLHVVFLEASTYDIQYVKRDASTGWASETLLFDGEINENYPVISKSGNNLVVFWESQDTIYSKRYSDGWQDTESLCSDNEISTRCLSSMYEADTGRLAVLYTKGSSSPYSVVFCEYSALIVTLSASPEELETGQQTTISWTVKWLNGTEVSSYILNITRDGILILQDSSASSLVDKFGSAGTHSYTCSGIQAGSEDSFASNTVSVEWTGEETKGEGTEGTGAGSFSDQISQVVDTVKKGLAETGLYWLIGCVAVIVIGGVYAGTKTKKVSRQARGTTGGGRSASPRGHTGGRQAQPRGVPKKRRRDPKGRFA